MFVKIKNEGFFLFPQKGKEQSASGSHSYEVFPHFKWSGGGRQHRVLGALEAPFLFELWLPPTGITKTALPVASAHPWALGAVLQPTSPITHPPGFPLLLWLPTP